MRHRFTIWLTQKWRKTPNAELLNSYRVTFSTLHGQLVLQHLLDEVYCSVCPSKDPIDLATHNARRSVVQEILENIDIAETPHKYTVTEE